MKKIKFNNTKGIKFELLLRKPNKQAWGDADGVCFRPKNGKGKIYVNPYRSDQIILNTIVHEITHAYFWDKSERQVTAFANTISRILFNDFQYRGDVTPALSDGVKYKRNKEK